jgi:hypothetical protein
MANEYTQHCQECIYYTSRSIGKKVCTLYKQLRKPCAEKITKEVTS